MYILIITTIPSYSVLGTIQYQTVVSGTMPTKCTQSLSSWPSGAWSLCCIVRKRVWYNLCNNICCMCVTSPQRYGHNLLEHFGGGDSPSTGESAINLASSATAEKSLSALGEVPLTGTALAVGIAVGGTVGGISVAVATGMAWLTASGGVLVSTQADWIAFFLFSCIIFLNASLVLISRNQSTAAMWWLKPL